MRWLSCFSGGTQRHRAQVLPLTADAFDQKYQPDPELDQPILSRETIIAGPVTPALKKVYFFWEFNFTLNDWFM